MKKRIISYNEANEMVKEIKSWAMVDDEVAHGREDKLRDRILYTIANYPPFRSHNPALDMQRLARIALKTNKIEFGRWCG